MLLKLEKEIQDKLELYFKRERLYTKHTEWYTARGNSNLSIRAEAINVINSILLKDRKVKPLVPHGNESYSADQTHFKLENKKVTIYEPFTTLCYQF